MNLLRSGFHHIKAALLRRKHRFEGAARPGAQRPPEHLVSTQDRAEWAGGLSCKGWTGVEDGTSQAGSAPSFQAIQSLQATQQNDTHALGLAKEHLAQLHESLSPVQRTQVLTKLIHHDLAYMTLQLEGLRAQCTAAREQAGNGTSLKQLQDSIYPGSLRTLLLEVTREAILVCLTGTLNQTSTPADSAMVIDALANEGRLNPALTQNLLAQMPTMLAQDRQTIARLLMIQPLIWPAIRDTDSASQQGALLLTLMKSSKVETDVKGGLLKALAPTCVFDNMTEVTKACTRSGLGPAALAPLLDTIRTNPHPTSTRALEINYVALVGEAGKLYRSNQLETIGALRDAWVEHLARTGTPMPQRALDKFDSALRLNRSRGVSNGTTA